MDAKPSHNRLGIQGDMAEFEDVGKKEEEKTEKGMMKHVVEAASFFYLFMQTSSIHGLNHLSTKRLHFIEYGVWMLGIGLGIYGAVVVSQSTWQHYQESPTVISMERDYKEWNTSFPAVTICPLEKYDNDSLNDLVERLPFPNKLELREFLVALAEATYGTFDRVPEFPEIKPVQYMQLVLDVKLKFVYTVSGSNSEANAIGKLTPTITEHGLCYAFNSDIAVYNSPKPWYVNGYNRMFRHWGSNNKTLVSKGWSFYGSPLDGDVFAQIMDMNSGYIVYIHSSNETSDFSSQSLRSEKGSYKTLDITALSIYSSEATRSLSVDQRSCRFLEESNLDISPVYSYNLCRNQCRMKLAYRLCKCVPHFYQPLHKKPICDVKGMHCLANHKSLLSTLRYWKTGKKVQCNCYPPCDDVNYVIENDHTMPWFLGTNLKWGMTKYPRMRLKRDILFGFKDVLVSVGSSAGLFLGCSVLSLMEVVYFFSLRLLLYICENDECCDGIFVKIFRRKKEFDNTFASRDTVEATPPPIRDQWVVKDKMKAMFYPFVVSHFNFKRMSPPSTDRNRDRKAATQTSDYQREHSVGVIHKLRKF